MPVTAVISCARIQPLLAAVTPRSRYLKKVRRPSTRSGVLALVTSTFFSGCAPRLSGSAFHLSREQVPQMTDTTRVPRGRICSGHPTSSKEAVWTAGKAWMTGTSPVKENWSCSRIAANNRFSSTGAMAVHRPTAPSCNVVSILIGVTAFKARCLALIDDIPRGTLAFSPEGGPVTAGSLGWRPRPRIDLHSSRHPGCEDHTLRHLIDVDAHRNALRQAHPGEDRVDRGEPLPVGLRVRHIDAARDAADMAANDLGVAHQLDAGRVTDLDRLEIGLLEIAVDPERVGIDERDLVLSDICVVAELRQEVRHPAIDRRADLRAF